MNNDKAVQSKRHDPDSVMSLVQDLTEIKMDIRKLQTDARIQEHKVIERLVHEKRGDCLSINYGALRRFYHD